MRTLRLIVPCPADPPRLDRFLAANVHGLSRKQVKALIDAGQARVEGRTARRAAHALQPGLVVELDYRPSMAKPPEAISQERILAQGPHWLAIDKPEGVPSHRPDDGLAGVSELLTGIPAAAEAVPIHRLDRETSGVLILASTLEARAQLSDLFATRAIEKSYRAVVHPAPKEESGHIE
ncbi:MAG: pseudouridine synthase, partial [Myxococcota bacterium]|nr:pseudouridine synthase [Myxococcota bacterium]